MWPFASLLFLAGISIPTLECWTSLSRCSWRSLLGYIQKAGGGVVPTMVGYSGEVHLPLSQGLGWTSKLTLLAPSSSCQLAMNSFPRANGPQSGP